MLCLRRQEHNRADCIMGVCRLPFSDPDPDAEPCSDLRAKLRAVSVVINGNTVISCR